jgi:hypothetical protein
MISDRCDFDDFVRKADGCDYDDLIAMADREATEAERRRYLSRCSDEEKKHCGREYAECLKGFIAYLRYGIKPAHIAPDVLRHFDRIRGEALQSKRPGTDA